MLVKMRGLSGSVAAFGLCLSGCFPSFDGLTGGASGDAALPTTVIPSDGALAEDAALPTDVTTSDGALVEAGCEERCSCIDSAQYPGGGVHKIDFSDVSDMVLNQGATSVAGALRLVGVDGPGLGSAYISAPFAFDAHTSLFAHFAIRIGGGAGKSGADGMAFVVQSSPMGAKAVGVGGGGLAYEGVSPSIAVEFDTFFNPATDPQPNHVAFLAAGNPSIHIAHAAPPFLLNDGAVHYVWMDYDWTIDLLEVYLGDEVTKPMFFKHAAASFVAALGNQVYLGASAATGTLRNEHELHGEARVVMSPLAKCRYGRTSASIFFATFSSRGSRMRGAPEPFPRSPPPQLHGRSHEMALLELVGRSAARCSPGL